MIRQRGECLSKINGEIEENLSVAVASNGNKSRGGTWIGDLTFWARFPSNEKSNQLDTAGVREISSVSVPDTFTKAQRSQIMAAIRSHGNKATELKLISIFRANRITGWRRGATLVGKPDFVFQKARVAVFVDGCFWHGCKSHCRIPRTNRAYWSRKIKRNIANDQRVNRRLRKAGWRVARIWAHSLGSPTRVARRIISLLSPAWYDCKNRGAE